MASGDFLKESYPKLYFVANSKIVDNLSVTTTYTEYTADISVAGYTPVAIIGRNTTNASSSGTGVSVCHWQCMYIEGNTLHYALNRHGSGTSKIAVYMWILYVSEDVGTIEVT